MAVAENWVDYVYPSTGIGGGTNNEHDRLHQVSHMTRGGDYVLDGMNYYGVSRLNRFRHRISNSILAVDYDYYRKRRGNRRSSS